MFHLTAPITKRQLELLQARKRLERRMSYDTLPAKPKGIGRWRHARHPYLPCAADVRPGL